MAMVQVSAWPDTAEWAARVIANTIGVSPPTKPNTVGAAGQMRILWLGPHRWLVVGPREPTRDLSTELAAVLPADVAAVVDLSAGRRVFSITGARARDLLAKELPIDLHPASFPPGHCLQSAMARIGVLIHAVERDRFDVFVYRAFARHFHEVLVDAAMEFDAAPAV